MKIYTIAPSRQAPLFAITAEEIRPIGFVPPFWRCGVYDRTSSSCHLCHKNLSFATYGKRGGRGVLQVEHSRARVRGGPDRQHNLYSACVECNADKGTRATRIARA